MGCSKLLVFLGLLLAMVLLISSEVAARDLAETSNTVDTSPEETNGASVEHDDGGYGGGGGNYGGGGHGGRGNYGGGGGGGRSKYGGGRGGKCRYGYCCGRYRYKGGCRCCNYAGEDVGFDQANP